jgi:hypothetical protein
MAVPDLLYGREMWSLKKRGRSRIQTAEHLRIEEGCTRAAQLGNEDVRNELDIFSLYCDIMAESRNSGRRRDGQE